MIALGDEGRSKEYPWKDIRGDYVLVPVPPWERRTLMNIFLVYTGVLSCLAVLWGGGALGAQATLHDLVWAVLLGNIILTIIGALMAYIGGTAHQSTYGIMRRVFGWYGSWIFGLIVSGIPAWGWFVVETWLFGVMIHDLAPHNPVASIAWASLWGGLLMTTTAYIGYAGLAFLSYFTVPAFFILVTSGFLAGIYLGGGFEKLAAFTPKHPVPLSLLVTQVVGMYIVGAIITPDIARFARRPRDGSIAWGVQIMALMTYYMIGAALLTMAMGGTYFSKAMLAAGLGLGAYFVAIFGQWTTNDNNLYSSALAWDLFVPVKKRRLILILGFLASILAWYVGYRAGASMQPFIHFLTILGTWIPPIGGVMVADFYLYQWYKGVPVRERYQLRVGDRMPLVNWVAWLSVLVGGLAAKGWLMPASVVSKISAALTGFLVALVVYAVLAIALDKAGVPIELGHATINEYGLPERR
ncbi:MAG: cytosine permease [Desulfurococcales archaeon]|nr:cytosine permease [Desulfurococcales archaeon]